MILRTRPTNTVLSPSLTTCPYILYLGIVLFFKLLILRKHKSRLYLVLTQSAVVNAYQAWKRLWVPFSATNIKKNNKSINLGLVK